MKCGTKRKPPAISTKQLQSNKQTSTQDSSRTIEQPNTIPQTHLQQGKNHRKLPPAAIGVIVAILVFIIIIVANNFKNPETEIEKVVTKYFQAVESLDYQTVIKLYHPDSPYVENIQDFLSTPKDLNIDVHGFYDLEIVQDYAEVTVLISLTSMDLNDTVTDELYFELIQERNQWYIYDAY